MTGTLCLLHKDNWLSLAEFWFNTNFHTSTKLTPFEALFGYPPPKLLDYILRTTKVDSVDVHLRTRQQLLSLLKQNLLVAQERMKLSADRHRSERDFVEGVWVYLRLLPCRQKSLRQNKLGKFSPRYNGPFQILKRIGMVSYKLDLPPDSKIHPTFHVSCLKAKLGQHVASILTFPFVDSEGILSPEPIAVLQERSHHLRRTVTQVLVQWQGEGPENATWESLY